MKTADEGAGYNLWERAGRPDGDVPGAGFRQLGTFSQQGYMASRCCRLRRFLANLINLPSRQKRRRNQR